MTDFDPDAPTVCVQHGRFVPCRKLDGCRITQNPFWVKSVQDYQQSTIPGLGWTAPREDEVSSWTL